MDVTDRELLNRFVRERCERAFHELVRRHLPMALAATRRLVVDSQLAEE
jgi:hypothetical protein